MRLARVRPETSMTDREDESGATRVKPSQPEPPAQASVRFTPGSMLADRYRIVALLGKGGMGEVYRAEDVKLGQQVALKFLPAQFAADREKLQRLYDEVRLGRQVSHPNVCRMYDVTEWEGHHFLAMEYIDGEDLASLLRRIGKLPHDKALDIARDLCAGLAAAHGLGIIHRDLKPANVMIDGRGDARITDFGLAALAEDLERRHEIAGTPAYMAPEQLEGGTVTQKTDLYALGLILYEMFTGKRVFEGATLGEIVSQQKSSSSQSSLSSRTAELEPAVQRVIVRCLEQDAAKRPGSIHAVIAALPGGDPLQAAIDAGETPSPEMLAAAGETGELKPAFAWPLLVIAVLLVLGAAALSSRVRLYGRVALPLEIDELTFRAREIVVAAGGPQRAVDSVRQFGVDADYRRAVRLRVTGAGAPSTSDERFSPILFGYRESPDSMIPPDLNRVYPLGNVPPLDLAGMAQVILEPDGRLRKLLLVPPDRPEARAGEAGYGALFAAAKLDPKGAREVPPSWRPPLGADRHVAWDVVVPGRPAPMHVEAASLADRVTWFEVMAPWRQPRLAPALTKAPGQKLRDAIFITLLFTAVGFGGFLAWRNVRRGRSDRKGAFRLALFVGALQALSSLIYCDHHTDLNAEGGVILEVLAWGVFFGAFCAMWYLALEPYLRRRWPRTLISWSRALQGRWADSLVARHLLVGVLFGAGIAFVRFLSLAVPEWIGWGAPTPTDSSFLELSDPRYFVSLLLFLPAGGVLNALFWAFVLLVAHLVVRNRQLAIGIVFVVLALYLPYENHAVFEWSSRLVVAAAMVWVLTRYGLLAMSTCLAARQVFSNSAPTLDPSAWYFARGLLPLAILIAIAVYGFVRALGGGALFREAVLED